jgi:thymidylate synthase (FAD)
MKVILANHTPNPVQEIFKAYKLCYAKGTQEEIKIPTIETSIGDVPDIQKMGDFIKPLMSEGHTSPLEHVSFTFYIMGVSRSLTHQLVRHRTGKYNQQSQRYVKLAQFEYVIPPEIEKIPAAKELFIKAMEEDQRAYDELTLLLMDEKAKAWYERTNEIPVESNLNFADNLKLVNKKEYLKIEKQSIEDARYIFPNACCSNITMTIDANNFRNLIAQRECVSAQWEVRELVKEMHKQAAQVVPFIGYKARWCNVICNRCYN